MAFGLIAEEVREVNSDLLGTQSRMTAPIYSLRTNQRDVPNELLKEHRRGEEQDCKIQEQETAVAELRSEVRNLAGILNEQATELRKVGAQLQSATPLRKRLRRIGKSRCVIAVLVPSTGERLPRARESERPYNIN